MAVYGYRCGKDTLRVIKGIFLYHAKMHITRKYRWPASSHPRVCESTNNQFQQARFGTRNDVCPPSISPITKSFQFFLIKSNARNSHVSEALFRMHY
mmetsp:Transcript_6546/g.14274  ORF Transcript_6546/g.14274 Transcript_6546/m.14274 type:complete len:97 (+) Transcript_6546:589-879(+)